MTGLLLALTALLAVSPVSAHDAEGNPDTTPNTDWDGMIKLQASAELASPTDGGTYAAAENVTFGSSVHHYIKITNEASGTQEVGYTYEMQLTAQNPLTTIKSTGASGTVNLAGGGFLKVSAELSGVKQFSAGNYQADALASLSTEFQLVAEGHPHPFTTQ